MQLASNTVSHTLWHLSFRSRTPVTFVKETVRCGLPLVRPQATTPSTPPRKRLSPHDEEDEGNDSDSTSSSSTTSVGARGVAFSMGTPSAFTDASDASDVSEEEEEESEDDADEELPVPEEGESVESLMDDDNSSASDGESSEDESEDDNCAEDADEEISSILESLDEQGQSLDREDESVGSYIGVMEDRDNLITVPKPKRVLSFNTLTTLNAEGHGVGSPKRFKCSPVSFNTFAALTEEGGHDVDSLKRSPDHAFGQPPILPSLSLGPAALTDVMTPHCMLQHRRQSPIISSSDDEELDRQLGEELDQQSDDDWSREQTPVPLLTPPQSPLTFEVDGETATVCEWPSNLAVDSAMASAMNLQPLTSEALRDFRNEPNERVAALQQEKQCEPSTLLTPILRGISMGTRTQ
jgi:hypothetical protein